MAKENLKVTVDSARIRNLLRRLREIDTKGILTATRKAFYSFDDAIADYQDLALDPKIQENLKGVVLDSRTGHLAQSINARNSTLLREGKGNARLTYRSKVPYASIHETGGKIVPVHSKYLKIPIRHDRASLRNLTMTKSGVHRPNFNKDDTFITRSKAGNLIIFLNKDGGIVPLYVLKTSVTIPARKWFSKSVEDTRSKLYKFLRQSVNDYIKAQKGIA
jgi:phage gpG-like protein